LVTNRTNYGRWPGASRAAARSRVILRIGVYFEREPGTRRDERGRHALSGPSEWVTAQLREYVDAGADGFVVNSITRSLGSRSGWRASNPLWTSRQGQATTFATRLEGRRFSVRNPAHDPRLRERALSTDPALSSQYRQQRMEPLWSPWLQAVATGRDPTASKIAIRRSVDEDSNPYPLASSFPHAGLHRMVVPRLSEWSLAARQRHGRRQGQR
jgi:hypothetical protein